MSDIQKYNENIVMPAVTPEEAKQAWQAYEEMKKAVVDSATDIQMLPQWDADLKKSVDRPFLKKSYWRKIATFFNLSTEVIEEKHEQLGSTMIWHFTVKATAPNGRSAIGTGSCDVFEKATKTTEGYMTKYGKPATPNSVHNTRTTAETRATNRAISNLVGGGEVSAEEVSGESVDVDLEGIDGKKK